jgi:hypothetical protein
VTYSVISGALPPGLRIEENKIVGTPYEVPRITEYTFCIRAKKNSDFSDRTFSINVDGSDEPVITTPAGDLAIGPNQQFFVIDNTFVDYQIRAFDEDITSGQTLHYFIAFNEGKLPPGLVLTPDGRITGFVQSSIVLRLEDGTGTFDNSYYDAYAYDFAVRPSNGYDSFFYDSVFFDYGTMGVLPKKLNRNFEFTVTVTDGDSYVKRTFNIFVVGDDYFRADNTRVIEQGLFTADVTYLKQPIWITASDLGTFRANNYITLVLDTYDRDNTTYSYNQVNADILVTSRRITAQDNVINGTSLTISNATGIPEYGQYLTFENLIFENNVNTSKIYQISNVADLGNNSFRLTLTEPLLVTITDNIEFNIGSLSTLPDGLTFDSNSAEIYGTVPYQSAITKNYKFTVTATRISEHGEHAVAARIFTLSVIGEIDSAITWVTDSNLGSIDANYISTLSVKATTNVQDAILLYYVKSGTLPPGLSLDLNGEIVGKVNQFGDGQYVSGELVFTTSGLTTFSEYSGSGLGQGTKTFTNTTFDNGSTTMDRFYQFTIEARDQFGLTASTKKFTVYVNTPNQLVYSNLRVKPFLSINQRTSWKSFINNTNIFTPSSIYRPNDPNFGVQTDLSMLVYAGIERKAAAQFVSAIGLNHKKKRFHFGSIKKATAVVPGSATQVYEVIYIEMKDPLEPNGKVLPNRLTNLKPQTKTITVDDSLALWQRGFEHGFDENGKPLTGPMQAINLQLHGSIINDLNQPAPDSPRIDQFITVDSTGYQANTPNPTIYYPSSVTNWQDRIKTVGDSERNYLPLWMRSIQPGERQELGFTLAVPLCYCKIGLADDIIANIKFSGFNFKLLDYTIDRYIIDAVEGQTTDKYLVFRNDRITV